MTVHVPEASNTTAIEPKVKAGGLAGYLAGVVVLALVNAFTAGDNELLLAVMPDALEIFVIPLVAPAVGVLAAYFAKHQWRAIEVRQPPGL